MLCSGPKGQSSMHWDPDRCTVIVKAVPHRHMGAALVLVLQKKLFPIIINFGLSMMFPSLLGTPALCPRKMHFCRGKLISHILYYLTNSSFEPLRGLVYVHRNIRKVAGKFNAIHYSGW